uniref:Uncharacterized protein n=1 Tax=Anguilla anguilla TaxID=7936 RepID=A0A0E9TI31_ANGAN
MHLGCLNECAIHKSSYICVNILKQRPFATSYSSLCLKGYLEKTHTHVQRQCHAQCVAVMVI